MVDSALTGNRAIAHTHEVEARFGVTVHSHLPGSSRYTKLVHTTLQPPLEAVRSVPQDFRRRSSFCWVSSSSKPFVSGRASHRYVKPSSAIDAYNQNAPYTDSPSTMDKNVNDTSKLVTHHTDVAKLSAKLRTRSG
ncbi:unnamed protein product [Phytophthora fragariaefolia]|uniref:Unnamed protein product n=1 Tax=Phytophthora fragariaefolia TaxID=1490495 RepID=A0A9W6YCS6_9STRA|nr:unnamed protein product [Phytophthora fragariaefolia]